MTITVFWDVALCFQYIFPIALKDCSDFIFVVSPIVPLFGLLDPDEERTTIIQNAGNQYSFIQQIIAKDLNILFLNAVLPSEF